ncbi:MAG: InlB B-repeat-containing protein, partial [Tannerella sp.]|nr:InlB B-repeat-containing protein [Tannerella sp.]
LVVRFNDNGTDYPVQPECDYGDSVTFIVNPALSLMMKKRATLNPGAPDEFSNSGTFANPVSVLYGDNIRYDITAVNASLITDTVFVTDTLPLYLNYQTGMSDPYLSVTSGGTPVRHVLTWEFPDLAPLATQTVSYEATPAPGVSASQPMFVNRAWITVSDTLNIVTDSATYHQGAGISIVTFSAIAGGQIFNAAPQAVDYSTSPRSGIIIAPDDGYRFSGWSHDGYYSLRGSIVPARSGIMSYDTLTVYGDVTLTANFELIDYPIHYYMNGCENPSANPATYTIETGNLVLEPPYKAGDVFVGWTGSNGEEPQTTVNIPKGSTGELTFYANFLVSGREKETKEVIAEDKIWSSGNILYVTTSKSGSVIRIYSTDGVLQKQHTVISLGTAEIKLLGGIYVVTINNGVGQKVRIN